MVMTHKERYTCNIYIISIHVGATVASISAHSLEIEKGRYYNIPRENRVCLSCKAGKVEDELHLQKI
jgi:hypothetical protein